MGCCQSTDRSQSDVPARASASNNGANIPQDSSRDAINQSPASGAVSHVDSSRDSSVLPARNDRLNQPIRAPSPVTTSPEILRRPRPWTRSQLEQERDAFFDTRVSGNPEVWGAVKRICVMLRQGDIAGAQTIADAADLTCPRGRVAKGRGRDRVKGGLYDSTGQLYDIPAWVLKDPEDIVEDPEKGSPNDSEDDSDHEVATAAQNRDEKGKGNAGEIVEIKARLSSTGRLVTVYLGMRSKVSVVITNMQEQIGNKRVRLYYFGKELPLNTSLDQTRWKPGQVINAFVSDDDDESPGNPT